MTKVIERALPQLRDDALAVFPSSGFVHGGAGFARKRCLRSARTAGGRIEFQSECRFKPDQKTDLPPN